MTALEESEAKLKGEKYGKAQEHAYDAEYSVKIKWTFHCVERVYLIDGELEEGAELFSRFLRNSEAESLLTPFSDECCNSFLPSD